MNTFNNYPVAKPWLMVLLLSAFAAGCGGGGGGGRDPILGADGAGGAGGAGGITVTAPTATAVSLGSASRFGIFGGSAGMTNTGIQTVITGSSGNTADIGTIATGTSSVTGFHDSAGDVYTETGANVGNVTGIIYTCTNSTTGPTSAGVNAASCTTATNALADTLAAYNALVAQPAGPNPGAGNLANLTLTPGTYTAAAGSFKIEGGDLTLDAQGNANAVWVFQMATTLTVGGPGAAFPQSIILANGALAKNVYWQVGSAATINAAGGGTMVGTIISQAGAAFSTAGNTALMTLNGRALSLGASVTLVNTVINVPAP
ncbi:MAG: ice-binding family protein [Polaromonas sp.]|uniref:ice-binding family protein n=1 Tax=Polaromonas sp. TaxID=1869339 RepID=UPI0027360E9C|nr:ice-binding family protein [Polaromonas sp.]MDP3799065.1 ice-binding family protein [Polaromonas sp.]